MSTPAPARSIAQRIEDALAAAAKENRTPMALVLGKEDYPAFAAWAESAAGMDIGRDSYRGVRVRPNEAIYLSRLMLRTTPGLPNALLL